MSRSVPVTQGRITASIAVFDQTPKPTFLTDSTATASPQGGDGALETSPPRIQVPFRIDAPPFLLSTVSTGTLRGSILRLSQMESHFLIAGYYYVRRETNRILEEMASASSSRNLNVERISRPRFSVLPPRESQRDRELAEQDVKQNRHVLRQRLKRLEGELPRGDLTNVPTEKRMEWVQNRLRSIRYLQGVLAYSLKNGFKEKIATDPDKGIVLMSSYFQYSHTVAYRTKAIFNLNMIYFSDIDTDLKIQNRVERIHGHHSIFRGGGTHHLVYIDDVKEYSSTSVEKLIDEFDIAVSGQIECEKDFDTDRSGSG
ncbi:hypothetical protein [Elioraea sp.]|uniref:hypothetical protein n=1 Tax=Elioraea sp. TaxID=2185103 RepID=UPI0025C06326|nr:hypothetical protein [Elioraea sp.]